MLKASNSSRVESPSWLRRMCRLPLTWLGSNQSTSTRNRFMMIWFRSFHEQLAFTRAKSRATEAFSTTPSFVRIFSRVNWSFWWKKSFSRLLRRLRLKLIESSLTHLIRQNPWWTVKAKTLKYRLPPLSPSLTSLKKRKERSLRHLLE